MVPPREEGEYHNHRDSEDNDPFGFGSGFLDELFLLFWGQIPILCLVGVVVEVSLAGLASHTS